MAGRIRGHVRQYEIRRTAERGEEFIYIGRLVDIAFENRRAFDRSTGKRSMPTTSDAPFGAQLVSNRRARAAEIDNTLAALQDVRFLVNLEQLVRGA